MWRHFPVSRDTFWGFSTFSNGLYSVGVVLAELCPVRDSLTSACYGRSCSGGQAPTRNRRSEPRGGRLFATNQVTKSDFVFGTEADGGTLCTFLRFMAPWPTAPFERFAWRRYAAALTDEPVIVVFEVVPTKTWWVLTAG